MHPVARVEMDVSEEDSSSASSDLSSDEEVGLHYIYKPITTINALMCCVRSLVLSDDTAPGWFGTRDLKAWSDR